MSSETKKYNIADGRSLLRGNYLYKLRTRTFSEVRFWYSLSLMWSVVFAEIGSRLSVYRVSLGRQ